MFKHFGFRMNLFDRVVEVIDQKDFNEPMLPIKGGDEGEAHVVEDIADFTVFFQELLSHTFRDSSNAQLNWTREAIKNEENPLKR